MNKKLTDLLQDEINSRKSAEEKMYGDLYTSASLTKTESAVGNEVKRVLQDVLRNIDKSTLDSLKQRKQRLEQIEKVMDSATMSDEEYNELSENIENIQETIAKDIAGKDGFFNKFKKTLSDNFIDASAILLGMTKNDPILAFGIKYFADKMKERKQKQLESQQQSKEMLDEDARNILDAEAELRKQKSSEDLLKYKKDKVDEEETLQQNETEDFSENSLVDLVGINEEQYLLTQKIYDLLEREFSNRKDENLDNIERDYESVTPDGIPNNLKTEDKSKGLFGDFIKERAIAVRTFLGNLGTKMLAILPAIGSFLVGPATLTGVLLAFSGYQIYKMISNYLKTGNATTPLNDWINKKLGLDSAIDKVGDFFANIYNSFIDSMYNLADKLLQSIIDRVPHTISEPLKLTQKSLRLEKEKRNFSGQIETEQDARKMRELSIRETTLKKEQGKITAEQAKKQIENTNTRYNNQLESLHREDALDNYKKRKQSRTETRKIERENMSTDIPIDFSSYSDTLAKRESDSNYESVNTLGFLGKYQFGAGALEDVGLVKKGVSKLGNSALNNPENWNIEGGKEAFLKSPEIQEKSIKEYTERNFKTLQKIGVITDSDDSSHIAGALMAAHLKGAGGAKKYINQGIYNSDAYGTSTSEYYSLGANSQNMLTAIPNKVSEKNSTELQKTTKENIELAKNNVINSSPTIINNSSTNVSNGNSGNSSKGNLGVSSMSTSALLAIS